MAILGFKQRFATPIKKGVKDQTIRGFRKYPVLPGEHLYLYSGLRTKNTKKIGEAQCTGTKKITIRKNSIRITDMIDVLITGSDLDKFARRDGFKSWEEMKQFWVDEHGPKCFPFAGTIIYFTLLSKKQWGKPQYTRKFLVKQFT